jgi:ComF family protein
VHAVGRLTEQLFATLSEMRNAVVETAFPRRCANCGRRGVWVCEACAELVQRFSEPWCARCGTPVSSSGCRCGELPSEIAQFRTVGSYGGWLRAAILAMKYGEETARAKPLAELIAPLLSTLGPWDWLVPVPLHVRRQRERGFNQAELLARAMAIDEDKIVTALIRRTRATPHQVGLDAAARRENVRGAFAVVDPTIVLGKRIVLIDDVMTTGSTLHQCAVVLLGSGATSVSAVTLAVG